MINQAPFNTNKTNPSQDEGNGESPAISRFAVFSDIHGNLPALTACLADMEQRGYEQLYCCGDLVGYGAQPNECCETIEKRKIPTVVGNHDFIATNLVGVESFNEIARSALEWTNRQLTQPNRNYLLFLPFVRNEGDFTFVHASPLEPENWRYILTRGEARVNFECFDSWICFVGHSHQPFVVEQVRPQPAQTAARQKHHDEETDPPWENNNPDRGRLKYPTGAEPEAASASMTAGYLEEPDIVVLDPTEVELDRDKRYLVNVGSVGQPRDRDSRACYVTVDLKENRLRFRRVEYPVEEAQQAILDAGLPNELADRLSLGR